MTEPTAPQPAPRHGAFRAFTNWFVRVFMPDDDSSLARQAWLERRFQSGMLSLMTGGILWGVVTLTNVDKSQAITAVKLQEIEMRIAGAYPAVEAKRDIELTKLRLDTIDHRVDALDGRVRFLERRAGMTAAKGAAQ